jgi:hypothetical protein
MPNQLRRDDPHNQRREKITNPKRSPWRDSARELNSDHNIFSSLRKGAILPHSYYGSFAGESLSGGKENPCTSTEYPSGQLSDSFFQCVKAASDENFILTVSYSPYNRDLSLSDFWFFGYIKTFLASRTSSDVNELLEAAIASLNETQPSEL